MNGQVIQTRCGLPYNKFDFFLDNGSGKVWYDVGCDDSEGYRDYISLEILYAFLFNYNRINWTDVLNATDINEYLIAKYKELNRELYQTIDLIFDIGAHHGHYMLNFSKIAKKVIAIEPDRHNYEVLYKNIRLNDINNIESHNKFVSDEYTIKDFGPSDFYRFNNDMYVGNRSVQVIKLDDFYSQVTDNTLIKIDTEGSELKVLMGAQKILKNFKCGLIIELHDFCENSHNMLPQLIDFGKYEILKITKGKNYPEFYQPGDDFSKINYMFFRSK